MADGMKLVIMTPERTLLDRDVSKVALPGSKGAFMVLVNHAPLISSLEEGDIVYVSSGKEDRIRISAGFVEIRNNRITVCAEV